MKNTQMCDHHHDRRRHSVGLYILYIVWCFHYQCFAANAQDSRTYSFRERGKPGANCFR